MRDLVIASSAELARRRLPEIRSISPAFFLVTTVPPAECGLRPKDSYAEWLLHFPMTADLLRAFVPEILSERWRCVHVVTNAWATTGGREVIDAALRLSPAEAVLYWSGDLPPRRVSLLFRFRLAAKLFLHRVRKRRG